MTLNDSRLSNESNHLTSVPLASGGSGGSAGGIWGVGLPSQQPVQPSMDIWTGPVPGSGGSTTTYGPIYNPAAPPPSTQNYFMANYGPVAIPAPPGGAASSHSGSGSHNRLMLAGSGSGSESASDGRASSVMGSDKSSLIRNPMRPSGTLFT